MTTPSLLASGAFLLVLCSTSLPAADLIEPGPYVATAKLADAVEILSPSHVRIDGWLGRRIDRNVTNRLLKVDTEPLLAGYRNRPGSHPWIGEHVGKWLHAASLAWAYSGDPALRAKLDAVADELIACQEQDGYLGTYERERRFGLFEGADWDVWSHKYNMIGLLTYHQYTAKRSALDCCRKMADLLIAHFPARKSLLSAGTHMGMAATSVLEPVVLLYRFTGEPRYLDFARYILKSWEEPNGPGIITTLLRSKRVDQTANGKAYEMLSNLVGLCELARATGDRGLLQPVRNAWEDVVANRLYLTGSASAGELFRADHVLPNEVAAHIGETCVTTTWIQLNLQLLRLTGEARYGDEMERAFYNHLAAAQHPRGNDWCYYTALEGRKSFDAGITCCHSSGPRGMALAVQSAYFESGVPGHEAIAVNTFESSRARIDIAGREVTIEQQSRFPVEGQSVLTVHTGGHATFGLRWRVPNWARPLALRINDQPAELELRDGWAMISPRDWIEGDRVKADFRVTGRLIPGDHANTGRSALAWGPFVLAYQTALAAGIPSPRTVGLAGPEPPRLLDPGLVFSAQVVDRMGSSSGRFITFADAGAEGEVYRVWVRAPGSALANEGSLFADGAENRSRQGNLDGSIIDDDPENLVTTFDGHPASQDWYAVNVPTPVRIGRVVFRHGKNFHNGGWFDTSKGKPRVQLKTQPASDWETVGELADYPSTTAAEGNALKAGQSFTLILPQQRLAVAVRVIGTPSSGDDPSQAFSSCGGLEAFDAGVQ